MEGVSGLSASDVALLNGDNNMGGMSSFIWIFALLILAGGGLNGFGANRTGDYGQYATAASQQDILFGQKFSDLDNKMDRLGNGIADATFALNNAITSEGRATQAAIAECCCANKEATAQVRYDMANFASAINSNIDSKFASLEKAQLQAQLDAQAQKINELNMQIATGNVVRYPTTSAWAMNGNPFCGGCGCNG